MTVERIVEISYTQKTYFFLETIFMSGIELDFESFLTRVVCGHVDSGKSTLLGYFLTFLGIYTVSNEITESVHWKRK